LVLLWSAGTVASAAIDLSQYRSAASAQRATLPLATRIAPNAGFLGVRTDLSPQGNPSVAEIAPDSPAQRAGVRTGDVILAIDGTAATTPQAFQNRVRATLAGKRATLDLARGQQTLQLSIECQPLEQAGLPATRPATASSDTRPSASGNSASRGPVRIAPSPPLIRKPVLRIAVIGIDFTDIHHNPNVTIGDWGEEFFSRSTYHSKNATGQNVFGSVNDFYQEVSVGAMRVDGKVFDWVEVSKKRMDYYTPPATRPATGQRTGGPVYDGLLIREVLEKFASREGPDALRDFDGIVFLYAGLPAVRVPGNVYWPHTSEMILRNRRMRYFIAYEGGRRMTNISLFCHEMGHILGLPDLYASRSGLTDAAADPVGLGAWCLMSIQVGNGRPQHMSAWCKERMGWIRPAVIDPSVRQHLILAPIENSPGECFKVPVRPDGTEYLLLENRRHIGFDASVPAEGLLIWHVADNHPTLIEAHGLSNVRAPWLNIRNIPYPTPRNDAFTPYSRPSSRTGAPGALPVYLTDIRRLEDGRIAFSIGYGFD
jgi:M6 family metalloprotease-like protein